MPKLTPADIERTVAKHKEICFYGTPENGYADSGFWKFLRYVKTKDSHGSDSTDTVKPLMGDSPEYLVVMFLFMLASNVLAIPKSRQMRVSWATTAFAVWHTMTAPYRETLYQTKKDDDANAMVSEGSKNPTAGRMDFIIQHLPDWLADPNIISGRGNQVGRLTYTPGKIDESSGLPVLWYGGSINAIPQGAHQVRQYTPSLFISDESAFQEEFASSMIAVRPAVTGGGKVICVSSVDAGSAFNRMVLESRDGQDNPPSVPEVVQRGMDLFGIEWPKGMRSWKTPSGVDVLEVHYSADPAKDPDRRGEEWVEEAVKGYVGGLDSTGWQTEMEINYGAGGGDPLFPFISSRKHPIFTKRVSVDEVINTHSIYAGYDWGTNNESAFEVVSFDNLGQPHAVWELYEPCENIEHHIYKMKMSPYWEHIKYIVCDPSITARKHPTASGLQSVNEVFSHFGVYFRPGRRGVDVTQAIRLKTEYWADPLNPRAFITSECPHLQQEIMDLRWEKHLSEGVASRKNNPEKIRQKKNHGFDAFCYLMDTRPRAWVAPDPKRPDGVCFNDLLEWSDRKARLEKTRSGRRLIAQGAWR